MRYTAWITREDLIRDCLRELRLWLAAELGNLRRLR